MRFPLWISGRLKHGFSSAVGQREVYDSSNQMRLTLLLKLMLGTCLAVQLLRLLPPLPILRGELTIPGRVAKIPSV